MNGTPTDGDPPSWLQAGLDHIDQGISVFDRALRLVSWNRRFVELIEFPPSMVRVGTPFEDFIRYNAQRGEYGPGCVDELVAERVRLARTFVRHEFERVRPNGVVLSVQGAPLADGGFVTVYTDVTQRRRAEALIREHSEELEERVRQRTTELSGVNAELRQSIARLQDTTLALQKSQERLRLITDAIPASIAYVDKDMAIRFANRRFAELFAHTSEGDRRPIAEGGLRDPALHRPAPAPGPGLCRAHRGLRISLCRGRRRGHHPDRADPRAGRRWRGAGGLRALPGCHRGQESRGRPAGCPQDGCHRAAGRRPGPRL